MSAAELPPSGVTWGAYIEMLVSEHGGWMPLADQLIHRAADAVEIAMDPGTVERGIRRLATRRHLPGGQYGRWLLRFFGLTLPVEQWLAWLGMEHSRFTDLPSGLRLEQLALWNRPPVSESPLAAWLHVGFAHAHHVRREHATCLAWLARAEAHAKAAGPAAELEVGLVRMDLETMARDHVSSARRVAGLEALLDHGGLADDVALPFRARLAHQQAAHFTRPLPDQPVQLERARALYAALPESTLPFVAFRKSLGLAYCTWQLGDRVAALTLARRAVDEAGDAGLVRMRAMALNMLSRVVEPAEAAVVNARARRMALMLEDEHLRRGVEQCVPPLES